MSYGVYIFDVYINIYCLVFIFRDDVCMYKHAHIYFYFLESTMIYIQIIGFRTMRIFLDQKPNLVTFEGGRGRGRGVCMSLTRNNPNLVYFWIENQNSKKQTLYLIVKKKRKLMKLD